LVWFLSDWFGLIWFLSGFRLVLVWFRLVFFILFLNSFLNYCSSGRMDNLENKKRKKGDVDSNPRPAKDRRIGLFLFFVLFDVSSKKFSGGWTECECPCACGNERTWYWTFCRACSVRGHANVLAIIEGFVNI